MQIQILDNPKAAMLLKNWLNGYQETKLDLHSDALKLLSYFF